MVGARVIFLSLLLAATPFSQIAVAQEDPRLVLDAYRLGQIHGKDEKAKEFDAVYRRVQEQLARTAQTDITAQIEWGHDRLHYGDGATFRATIINGLDVPIQIDRTSMEMRIPCELYGEQKPQCPPLTPLFDTTNKEPFTVLGRGHILLQWHLDPLEYSIIPDNSGNFRTSSTHKISLDFLVKIAKYPIILELEAKNSNNKKTTSKEKNANKIDKEKNIDETEFDDRSIPISTTTNLPVDLNPWTLSYWSFFGAIIAGIMHAATRMISFGRLHKRELWDLRHYPSSPILREEFNKVLVFTFVGALMAALLAASVGISAEAKRLISARILDAQGAMVFGFVVHFVTYDLGYTKLVLMWRNLLNHS